MARVINPLAVKVAAAIAAVLVVVGAIGFTLWTNSAATQAALGYHARRQALDASLRTAAQQGYTSADLAPITSRESTLDTSKEPWWLPGRAGYFENLETRTGQLQTQLQVLEQRLLDQTRGDVTTKSNAAKTALTQAQQANAPDPDVQGLQMRLDTVARAEGAAHTLKDYRAADQQAQSVSQDAAALLTAAQAENQAIQSAASQLVTAAGGVLAAVQKAGNDAVTNANNDATVAAYLGKTGTLKNADAIANTYNRLQKYAGMISSGDVNQAAQGAAAAQRYAGQIRDSLSSGMPSKSVIVSFQDQHLYAYEGSKTVLDTPVTTGIWGQGDFGTDFGPMKVLWKSHPWTMHSPWPKNSPYWYPDTVVQWTTFFTNTGESIHDAAWEPDSLLGPGSQYNLSTRSHGCIHVPFGDAQWMFNWAEVGMPVIVYPGDGTSVSNQLSKITTDDSGNPKGIPH